MSDRQMGRRPERRGLDRQCRQSVRKTENGHTDRRTGSQTGRAWLRTSRVSRLEGKQKTDEEKDGQMGGQVVRETERRGWGLPEQ